MEIRYCLYIELLYSFFNFLSNSIQMLIKITSSKKTKTLKAINLLAETKWIIKSKQKQEIGCIIITCYIGLARDKSRYTFFLILHQLIILKIVCEDVHSNTILNFNARERRLFTNPFLILNRYNMHSSKFNCYSCAYTHSK